MPALTAAIWDRMGTDERKILVGSILPPIMLPSQDTQPLDVKPRGREGAGEPAAGQAEQSSLTAAPIR